MQEIRPEPRGVNTPQSPLLRQLIFSAFALGVMGLGAWSLLGQEAPYHPPVSSDEVSRNGVTELLNVGD